MTVKETARTALNRLGYNVTRFPVPYDTAGVIKTLIQTERVDLVLDVGAFHGEFCRILREDVGYTGNIVSIEPCSESFQHISARFAGDAGWRGLQYAVGDTDTTAVLNTYAKGVFNSLHALNLADAERYEVKGEVKQEQVRVRKLDTIWAELPKNTRVFLKMDTQGHDLAAVRGAAEHLDRIVGIQSEMAIFELYDGMTRMPEALSSYLQLGFAPMGFFPVNQPLTYPTPPEFDVIFRRIECSDAFSWSR